MNTLIKKFVTGRQTDFCKVWMCTQWGADRIWPRPAAIPPDIFMVFLVLPRRMRDCSTEIFSGRVLICSLSPSQLYPI